MKIIPADLKDWEKELWNDAEEILQGEELETWKENFIFMRGAQWEKQ